MKRLALDKTSDTGSEGSENAMTASTDPNAICYGSESSVETKFETCKCNNNVGDCDFGAGNREIKVNCACLKENRQNDGNISLENTKQLQKRRGPKKRKPLGKKIKRENEEKDMCQALSRIKKENKSCGIPSQHDSSTVGGDGEEKIQERSRCRQHEPKPSSNEINRPDVTTSCDLTSNSLIKSKSEMFDQNTKVSRDCPTTRTSSCSVFQSTCSEGSYSRRKHHKHHKHKKRSHSPVQPEEDTQISPKVNPIFLWVRQEDTKIVEVLCEDYDHRNRLRLTRTHLGWRAIPKTKTFAEAIIPKATVPKEEVKELNDSVKPKHARKMKKRKRAKKKKEPKIISDNPNQIRECSVALYRDDLAKYKALMLSPLQREADDAATEPKSYLAEPDSSISPHQSRPSSPESISEPSKSLSNFRKLTKSNSCDFSVPEQVLKSFPRSVSLDLKLNRNIDFKVQKDAGEVIKSDETKELSEEIKSECEVKKQSVGEQVPNTETDPLCESNFEKTLSQRNHSESVVIDMTKHDLDFNDADCDELGQLLKDIPDLEFVEEEELEEIDDEEDWLKPTDLTVQKSAPSKQLPGIKLPVNIMPVVTLKSSVKVPEPLTAPLPEVTITPISKPKPAHQQKPQNNFLESLLSSSRSVKPENCDLKKQSKPLKFSQCERKMGKHFQDDVDSQVKNKKLKVEDITLKSLLSKHQRPVKPAEECSNSRLQELLTDTISSDPITQLKEVLSNPLLSVPDPLLVPRARLPALVASPAVEIPRLLSMHLEKTYEEAPCPPVTDSDILEVSLSNLQSLLSCTPEKLTSANTQDLAKYQKSLETFLEWQRYQSELVESQIKNSKSMLSGFPGDISDVAAATAFSQMLWLPYLNQFDFNCNASRDFMSLANSMLVNDYQANCGNLSAPPQINTNQVSQPSPFLTPTSPMEFESHLKTLAMWQEALMMQQNSQFSRTCTKVSSTPSHQDARRNGKFSGFSGIKKSNAESGLQGPRASTPISSKTESMQNLDFDIYQGAHAYQNYFYKRQNRQNNFQQKLDHQSQNQFRRFHQNYSNHELLKPNKISDKNQGKKLGPVPGCISVKPLANLIDKNNHNVESKTSWPRSDEDSKKNADFASQVASKLMQFNTQIQRTKRKVDKPKEEASEVHSKPSLTETPKLKVKNLVDPNMSPPKLLKQIAPEHLPIVMDEKGPVQDDGQANLWHPLFGSNQIKLQPYNSPWRWTTVTVNGE